MARTPTKAIEGRRIRLILTTRAEYKHRSGDEGTVDEVMEGMVFVKWDDHVNDHSLLWEAGDRWMIIPDSATHV